MFWYIIIHALYQLFIILILYAAIFSHICIHTMDQESEIKYLFIIIIIIILKQNI